MYKIGFYFFIGVVSLAFLATPVSYAQESKRNQMSKAELIKRAESKLEGTAWDIKLQQMGAGRKVKEEADTLYFKDGKISSEKLLSEDFNPSNYTVRVKGEENETVIWETMQTNEEEGVAFWRGEITGEIDGQDAFMRGVLSLRKEKKQEKDYTFTSTKKRVISGEEKRAGQKEQPAEELSADEKGAEPIEEEKR